ncbi:MAG: tetratricopeptide repeat protein, partial [Ktedonobacteraceae bacterium]|nr:tetratricopeptide repeat protein [Ktedonobacteraceae bacterium]
MKKPAQVKPNLLLKRERELRGWSQKYVAECIGADHYYLSRWEHGTASPSPYYRQKLCTLFDKNAGELGLLPQIASVSVQEAIPEKSEGIHDAAIPPLSIDRASLVGRDTMLSRLKERLCSGSRVAALNGLPGAGKTTLAVALAHDDYIADYFSDGILWAGLGPHPGVLGHLSRWGNLLGISPAEARRLTSTEAWIRSIRAAIGRRRMLLVIDDIWELQEALAFKVGGPHCSYLITTRFPYITTQWTGEDAITVRELSEADSIVLLARLVPELVALQQSAVQSLVQSVGGLPLALTIIGKYLRAHTYSGQPRRLQTALEKLKSARERLHINIPQALLERSPSLPDDAPLSLQTIIRVSDQQLDAQAQKALRALSVFPPKPNTFSEEAALAVCQAGVEVIDSLTDVGLLESGGPCRYTFHQVVADYAREHLRNEASYLPLVRYIIQYIKNHEQDYKLLEQECANILVVLNIAFNYVPAEAVQGTNIYVRFLIVRGLYGQAQTILTQAEKIARTLDDSLELATTLMNLGKVAQRLADYTRAESYLREGLALARQNEHAQLICDLLLLLGGVTAYQGNPHHGAELLQEALELARQDADAQHICALLRLLGACESDQGNYRQAESSLQEALTLAHQNEDREQLIEVLVNLGETMALRGNYTLAEDYWQQALQIGRSIGYRHAMNTILGNLGAIATEQGQNHKAQQHLKEALSIARQMEDPVAMTTHLANLGALALEQDKYDQAEIYLQEALTQVRLLHYPWLYSGVLNYWGSYQLARPEQDIELASATFRESLDIATQGGYRECRAEALYGLARTAQAQGKNTEAYQRGQESLA